MAAGYFDPLLYQYGVGGAFFLIGLWIIVKRKACVLARPQDRFWFGVLVVGFLFYFVIHVLWYLAAIYLVPHGGAGV